MAGTKAERFKRLAEKRVTRAIRDLRLVGNLANRNNYEFDANQVAKILAALKHELRELHNKFENRGSSYDPLFKL